jgi:alpha-L-arabinofuranosidase
LGDRWEDGVGPAEERPARRDQAWKSIETNQFGLGEFVTWATYAGVEPIVALNLGTRGPREAVDLLQYANLPGGANSELGRRHGRSRPFQIRTWCLGNEIDGPWQIGHKPADEYGRLARATARAMRTVDPGLRLVLCGSSGLSMPTFGTWDLTVLEHAFDEVDLISAHAYYDPEATSQEEFLASAVEMDRHIKRVIEIADEVARRRASPKRIGIAFDEWNVWYMSRHQRAIHEEWLHAPRLCEDTFTITDAVVVGSLLMTLVRNSERVGIACQAQLVNTIAPIRAEPGGPSWRQVTFHPFSMIARHARGDVLDLVVESPDMEPGGFGPIPAIDALATLDPETRVAALFLLNRSRRTSEVTVDTRGLGRVAVTDLRVLSDDDPGAANTEDAPDRVIPRNGGWAFDGVSVKLEMPAVSFAMLRLGPA